MPRYIFTLLILFEVGGGFVFLLKLEHVCFNMVLNFMVSSVQDHGLYQIKID